MPKKDEKDVDWWINNQGFLRLDVPSGSTESPEIPFDPLKQEVSIFGQVFGEGGHRLAGKRKPHFKAETTDGGLVINFAHPLSQAISILYKIHSSDDDVADWDSEPTM